MLDRKQPVIFAGENHMITLFEPGQAEPIAAASVWRCSYSAQGEGFVLCLWHTPDQSGSTRLAAQGIYSDNMPLAIMVRDRFNQYFAGFDARGFARIEPQPARFQQYGEGMRR
ncbi:MAG TPA: hypothetical protein PKC19_21250, partial [Roseiflexaceae bacterium]|nr:hypothetical protein [Roseiflexaceae bacterium]